MRARGAAALAVASVLILSACENVDTFADECAAAGGSVLEDGTSKTVVTSSGGQPGVGTTRVTVRLCVVDGDVTAMEVR